MTETINVKPTAMPRPDDDIEHIDNPKGLAAEAAEKGQGVSGYETLSLWETVKLFKVNTAYCFLVAFSAATDGYQIGSVPHSYICSCIRVFHG